MAGALYVPQVGIINPGEMSPANSIEIAVWAAVGGRGSLIGPVVGAFLVNGAKSWLTVSAPEFWLYFLGALFIAVMGNSNAHIRATLKPETANHGKQSGRLCGLVQREVKSLIGF